MLASSLDEIKEDIDSLEESIASGRPADNSGQFTKIEYDKDFINSNSRVPHFAPINESVQLQDESIEQIK